MQKIESDITNNKASIRKFLLQTFVFLLPIAIISYFILIQMDGSNDPVYLRFTKPKQCSMIIGTSRAAQGLMPEILNNGLGRNDIYNFSFTIEHSPFGPTYLNSIKKKLHTNCSNGIFIVAADPWSISALKEDAELVQNFKERKLALGNTPFINTNPNLWYIWKNYNEPLYTLVLKPKSKMFLHNDGWLEVTVKMTDEAVKARTERKLYEYTKDKLYTYASSSIRLNYLQQTLELLKQHGQVYLVRMPISSEMMELENQYMPEFDSKMNSVSVNSNIPYINLTILNDSCAYTDGNHLYKDSGKMVSEYLAKRLKAY
jgi:hypothetical protein